MEEFTTKSLAGEPDAIAPDGCEVRILVQTARGSLAHFALAPGQVSKAVAHRSIDEVWYFVSGRGRMWRSLGAQEETVAVAAGVALSIPVGTKFQFRNDGDDTLAAVGTTMPPWPGEGEAFEVAGPWEASG